VYAEGWGWDTWVFHGTFFGTSERRDETSPA
jgi:hypothetical protein